jgi:tRNA pseudouridine65 synthase
MSAQSSEHDSASLPLGSGVSVVKAENGIVALKKPEGVRAHPNDEDRKDSGALIDAPFDLERECYILPDGRCVYLLHRLDAPTSGLILVSTDETLAAKIKELFAAHKVRKTYEALVFGSAGRGKRVWRDRLRTKKSSKGARTSIGSGDMAIADVEVKDVFSMKSGLVISRISLKPETGRTHQLRVQCAARHLPIVGDATYGDFALNRTVAKETGIKRLCLHSASIRLEFENAGRKTVFEASCQAPDFFRNPQINAR